MPKPTLNPGGNAQIKKQGHTTNGKFGSDPDRKDQTNTSVRELGIKAK